MVSILLHNLPLCPFSLPLSPGLSKHETGADSAQPADGAACGRVWRSERKDECLVCGARIHIMNFRFLISFGRQITSIPMNNHVCYANWLLCAGLSRTIVHNYNSYLLLANQLSYLLHPWEASPCCSSPCV